MVYLSDIDREEKSMTMKDTQGNVMSKGRIKSLVRRMYQLNKVDMKITPEKPTTVKMQKQGEGKTSI